MGKLVRALVVVCLLLSIVALVLGMQLFGKRELLKGRAQKLESAVVQLGALIEDEAPKSTSTPQYPERDISPSTLDFLDEQEYSTFWSTYSNSYEIADAPMMNIQRRENELMTYYKRSADGDILKDARGLKVTSGAGTMQGLLDELLKKAESQYNRLNETRQELADTRADLVAANREANEAKSGYRDTLSKLKEAEEDVARMQGELQVAQNEAAEAKEAQRALEDAITEERRQLQFVEEQKIELEDTVTQLKDEIAELRGQTPSEPSAPAEQALGVEQIVVDPGIKGSVVSVNETWNFVIISLTDAALREILGDDLQGQPGAVEFMIKRNEGEDELFITKVKLQQVSRENKLAIAAIMSDWQQTGVEQGDIVFK